MARLSDLAAVCAKCGHQRQEHGTMRSLVAVDSNREVCLLCDGWTDAEDAPQRGSPARHRYRAALEL